ncbi:MAG: PGPGW domain-containing protein [Verrucomicrobiota bacterium]
MKRISAPAVGHIFSEVPNWIWYTIGIVSVITFVASIVILRIAVSRMAPDYFVAERDPDQTLKAKHPAARDMGIIGKNFLGAILLLAGIIMLATPGQGLLTILMGVVLLDFPGKRRMEIALIRRPAIHKSINWMRKRDGKEPLIVPDKPSST